ncbi:MAG: sugar kinase [Proteobacteria bacterium]|nr:sugar kinase [Pseudomonadota bacterium]
MASDRKVVLVTRHTRIEELIARFHTLEQARFYVEHLGADFSDYVAEHVNYLLARHTVEAALASVARVQLLDRGFLPTYLFAPDDVVVALGQDGIVANTLKYLDGQPLVGVNPDPRRHDGGLLPFRPAEVTAVMPEILAHRRPLREVTMAQAALSDGQTLFAVNDLFIGPKSHTSARYELQLGGQKETQSSSGIIVSTGLGSTAWMTSIVTGSLGVARGLGLDSEIRSTPAMPWDAKFLRFAVREPFPSIASSASLIFGTTDQEAPMSVLSLMPENGVIFSDGIESDYLAFNSGVRATIGIAERIGYLVH